MNNVAPLREQIVTKLYSAVLSDALDAAAPRQAMRPFLRPLDDSLVLFGRVRTGLYANSYHVDLSKNPYAVEIALVDDLQTGDVPVLACGGPTEQIAPWGELLTTLDKYTCNTIAISFVQVTMFQHPIRFRGYGKSLCQKEHTLKPRTATTLLSANPRP